MTRHLAVATNLKLVLCGLLICAAASTVPAADAVHLANGIKIGEVRSTSAIVWTRVTRDATRNEDGPTFIRTPGRRRDFTLAEQMPEGATLEQMQFAVPGAPGEVRVVYSPAGGDETRATPWREVRAEEDYTHQFGLEQLEPATRYRIRVEVRPVGDSEATAQMAGSFTTAAEPDKPQPVVFTVVTGQRYDTIDSQQKGNEIYRRMLDLDPTFFVHTGDIVYYDKRFPFATNVPAARFKWHRMYSYPNHVAFHRQVPSYFIKDDHDTLKNDCWPGQTYGDLTWEQGLALFREQVPMGEKTYRTIRWGKDLQIWLVEGRDFRSPNRVPDGPDKTIWGKEQKQWLFRTMTASDATFRVLISATPIVGPDRSGKKDNHANSTFSHEGNEVRKFLGGLKNTFVVCGDRHWQYASVDPDTGVEEFCSGPTTRRHAGGFSQNRKDPKMHRYLNIIGGFLSVSVQRRDDEPVAIFRHHQVDGSVANEVTKHAE
jgi:alkaline phosphatase D